MKKQKWPFMRGTFYIFVLKCWPLVALDGWLLVRGTFDKILVGAKEFWPYKAGGRCSGGPFKRGTTVYGSAHIL